VAKVSSEYTLGDGDKLNIQIVNGGALNDALSGITIGAAGTISIPYLGNVQAAGLTSGELEAKIGELLAERQLLKNPEVLVYITDYKAKPFFVMGEVDNPGEYMMSQEITLMEAILLAGGIDPTAGSEAFLYRRRTPPGPGDPALRVPANPEVAEPGVEITKIDIRPLKLGGVPNPDIPIRKGDLLLVPKSKDTRFFVIGDVRAPGVQTIPRPVERIMFVSQAIAQAGGPNRTAKMSEGILVRYDEKGQREEMKVDFLAILKRKQPDIEIRPNDIIFIPGSNAKATAYGILGMVPSRVEVETREAK
jgi:protein involved in polysaccharide export with SLBB domain